MEPKIHYVRVYARNETKLMHHVSSVYSVTILLHVSGLLVAHHQVVTMYICNKWYVLYVLVDCQLAPAKLQSAKTYNTHHLLRILTLLPPDDGQLVSPKHVQV
jgi:hypothetical protein